MATAELDFFAMRSALSLGCLLTVKGFGTLPSSRTLQKLPRGRGGPVPGPLLRRSPRGFADATAIRGVTVQALEDTREQLGVFGFTHDEPVDTVVYQTGNACVGRRDGRQPARHRFCNG